MTYDDILLAATVTFLAGTGLAALMYALSEGSSKGWDSSLIIGNLAMVKLIRHIFPGIHPEVEMTRYLTNVGYQNTGQLLGEVARTSPEGNRYTMIIVQRAIRNQGDAWNWMLGNLRRAIDEIVVTGLEGEGIDEHFKPLVNLSATIGTRLGELHVALAQPGPPPWRSPCRYWLCRTPGRSAR